MCDGRRFSHSKCVQRNIAGRKILGLSGAWCARAWCNGDDSWNLADIISHGDNFTVLALLTSANLFTLCMVLLWRSACQFSLDFPDQNRFPSSPQVGSCPQVSTSESFPCFATLSNSPVDSGGADQPVAPNNESTERTLFLRIQECKKLRLEDLQSPIVRKRKGDDKFRTVGVIGLGIMGQGIAETISSAGIEVIGVEKNEKTLALVSPAWQRPWTWRSNDGKDRLGKAGGLSRVKGSIQLADLRNCDIVVEAVDESYEVKRQVIGDFYAIGKEDAVFISNTATLSLSKLAQFAKRADRIIGMHFLNPVPKSSRGDRAGMKTSDETYALVKAFAGRIGKTAVEVFEYPGFITTVWCCRCSMKRCTR